MPGSGPLLFLAWFPRLPGLLSIPFILHPCPPHLKQRMCRHFRRSFFTLSLSVTEKNLSLCQKAIQHHYPPARDRKDRVLPRGITQEDGWDWILCRKPQETATALFSTAQDKARPACPCCGSGNQHLKWGPQPHGPR